MRQSRSNPERVSVVIPVYNRAHLLPSAIQSVDRQTFAELCDIIVVDDGSTDDTRDVTARYGARIKYVYQENAGAGAARNTGVRESEGEYVAFLDSDDAWEPDKIERQLAAFRRWPEVVMVGGRATAHFRDGGTEADPPAPVPPDRPTDFAPRMFYSNFLHTPTVMVRRQYLEQAGLFSRELKRAQDYHMWARLSLLGPCVYLDRQVATFSADTPESLQRDRDASMQFNLCARDLLARELARRPDCREPWRRGIVQALASLRDRAYRHGRYDEALRYGLRVLRYEWRRPKWEWGRLFASAWHAATKPTVARVR